MNEHTIRTVRNPRDDYLSREAPPVQTGCNHRRWKRSLVCSKCRRAAAQDVQLLLGDDYDEPGVIPRRTRIDAGLYVQAGLDAALGSGLAKKYQGEQNDSEPNFGTLPEDRTPGWKWRHMRVNET